jgi:hypothetical protein
MGMILTVSSDALVTGLQNKQLKVKLEQRSSLYVDRHGILLFQV